MSGVQFSGDRLWILPTAGARYGACNVVYERIQLLMAQ